MTFGACAVSLYNIRKPLDNYIEGKIQILNNYKVIPNLYSLCISAVNDFSFVFHTIKKPAPLFMGGFLRNLYYFFGFTANEPTVLHAQRPSLP